VIDGDTVELSSGERIRYLMLDTPEDTNGHVECYGPEAREFNRRLVEGQRVGLRYDRECRDRYGRALAYVSLGSREVNTALVAEGFACVLHVPPNGDARAREFEALEAGARVAQRGLWGACERSPCE
jgi:micrococcal nuclease